MSLMRKSILKWGAAATLAAAALAGTASASAGVAWSVGVSMPGMVVNVANPAVVYPAVSAPMPVSIPVYYAPPPALQYRPAPVYYRYYRPAPVHYGPPRGAYRPAPVYYRGNGPRY